MSGLLKQFFDDHIYEIDKTIALLEPADEPADLSNFTVVDGEEGDFGEVKYFIRGIHAATKVVEGGDCEYFEWTPYGKSVLANLLEEALRHTQF